MKKDIYEVGILVGGFTLCSVEFTNIESNMQKEMRDAIFQGIVKFVNAFSAIDKSHMTMKKLTIYFTKKKLQMKDAGFEDIICYMITESQEKKSRFENEDEKRLSKNVKHLNNILDEFMEKYKDTPMVEVSMYEEFQPTIIKYAEKLS